jgi:hypothetical protein
VKKVLELSRHHAEWRSTQLGGQGLAEPH